MLDFPTISLLQHQCNKIRHNLQWTQQLDFSPMTNAMIEHIARKLQEPGVCAISDGSPKDGRGAAAWIIADELPDDGTLADLRFISGGFRVPGAEYAQDSYRCELAGLIAILSALREFVKQFHNPDLFLSLACDGKGALQRLFSQDRPSSITDSQWDMILWAQDLLRQMPCVTLYWHHVKGHQDNDKSAELDQWAQLNVEMDLCAKKARVSIDNIPHIPLLNSQWTIRLQGQVVSTDVFDTLRTHCLSPPAIGYWVVNGHLGQGNAGDIHWIALGEAIHDMDVYRRRFVTKHSCGWCGVGQKLKLWNYEPDDRCPRCRSPAEDAVHVWLCPDPSTETLWQAKMKELDTWLITLDTAPPIVNTIISNFNAWRGGSRHIAPRSRLPGLQVAAAKQNVLGWTAAFEGRWATEFAEIQDRYYKFMQMRKTGKRWLVSVIKKTWEIAWSLWDHRNRVQERVREAHLRATLKDQVRTIFMRGPNGLHPASQRLFTHKSLEERLKQKTVDLQAWVRRVQAAQERAINNPERLAAAIVAREQRELRAVRRMLREAAAASAEKARQRQARLFNSWRTPPI
jgi:hypothetical protein